jgi:hypothetical protein
MKRTTHAPSLTHPGWHRPAALAMAEREQAGGTALLRAVALGYRTSARACQVAGRLCLPEAGHDTHAFGPDVGAAAAAGALAGLGAGAAPCCTAQRRRRSVNYARDTEHVERHSYSAAGCAQRRRRRDHGCSA